MNETIQTFNSIFVDAKLNYSTASNEAYNLTLRQCQELSLEFMQLELHNSVLVFIVTIIVLLMFGCILGMFSKEVKHYQYYMSFMSVVCGIVLFALFGGHG